VLKGVSASFDGTAAASSYVPAVQVIDPSGFTVGTYVLGQTLAAGASADVAWFPGVTPSAATTGTPLETTNTGGTVTVNPTTEILIGANLTLSNPGAGIAQIVGSAAGSGIAFGVDNVDSVATPGLEVETAQRIPNNFSNPASVTFGDDPTRYNTAINAGDGGMLIVCDNSLPLNNNGILVIEGGMDAGVSVTGAYIQTDTTAGAGQNHGLILDIGGGSATTEALGAGASSNSGPVTGVNASAFQNAASANAAIGVRGSAVNFPGSTGQAIGLRGTAQSHGSGLAIAILAVDGSSNHIFEVRDDGSIHGLAAVGAITWDL
jgi:hypothetical protein